MITYTWSVNSMMVMPEQAGEADVVIVATYSVKGVEEGYEAELTELMQNFSYTGGEDFTPYGDLTEAQVIGWIKDALGENGITSIEANIASQIENQKNPPLTPETLPLPWVE